MQATVTYQNGQIILEEELPIKGKSAKVIVTLVEDAVESHETPKRQFGRLEGAFTDPYWSSKEFNAPWMT